MLKLIIEDDEGRKTVVPFVRDEITIGRQEGNTIRLTERNVSRRHARLVRQNGHVLVEDLGSYTGVRLNGERIQGQAQLQDGDLIQIGDYDLALQKEATTQSAATVRMPNTALQAALDEELHDASAPDSETETDVPVHEDEQDTAPSPADARRHSTSVIRRDQVEMSRPRRVQELDPEEAPRLLVVSAEFRGQEFSCIRTEMRIGRTDDNDIALDHRSLSRTHAKIVREDSGEWRILDMQSANGLSVNGESYAQATLAHGDVIELGHVKLRFIGAGQSADGLTHDGVAKGSKKPLLLAVGGLALLVVGVGAAWFLFAQPAAPAPAPQPTVVEQQPEPQQPPEPAPPPKQEQPPESAAVAPPAIPQLEEKLLSAKDAIAALDFDTAVRTLETLADANGQRPTEVEELLAHAQAEQQVKQDLELAEKELAANRPQAAMKYLDASEGTLAFTEQHAELKQKVQAALAPPKPTVRPSAGTARRPSGDDAKQLYEDGIALARKQQHREAETRFKKCLQVDATFAPCYMMLGSTAARLGRLDEGAEYYREFLRLAPNHEMAASVRKHLADYEKSRK